jgi:hypothetical protein
MFPADLEQSAFRASNGEFGWTRSQIPLVVDILRSNRIGILGGELWWVREGSRDWVGLIPQRHGPPGIYHWETARDPAEPWLHFVDRGASDALAAVERWPMSADLPDNLPGRILYNLTWVSDTEFEKLAQDKHRRVAQ